MSTRTKVILALLMALAGCEFIVRGPARALASGKMNDLLSPCAQTRAWIRGSDPYSQRSLLEFWPIQAGPFPFPLAEIADGTLLRKHGIPTAYPPTSFVLIAPLTVLPWPALNIVWMALSVSLFVLMLYAVTSLAALREQPFRLVFFLVCALAFAPFHTGIAIANVAIVAVELGVIAVWKASAGQDWWAAALMAAATGLKPQIGVCFLVFYLLRRRWRIVGTATVMILLLVGVALLRLQAAHVTWLHSYISDNEALFKTGVFGDFTSRNPTRFGLLNLQVVLFPIAGSANWANACALGLVGALFCSWVVLSSRKREEPTLGLHQLSIIAVLSLLPVYHRFYDAALLVIPLAYCLSENARGKPCRKVLFVFLVPFFLPGGSLLEHLQKTGQIPRPIMESWWWQSVIMPHQIWSLLLLGLLLFYGAMEPVIRSSRVWSSPRHVALSA